MLYGDIFSQRLTLVNTHVVADTIDYLEVKFFFKTNDWDGLEKWVHFANSERVYDIRLSEDGVQKEDHLNLTAGKWRVYLHGNRYENGQVIERITTDEAVIYVAPTGTLDGEPFPEMPASVTEQILARLENVEQNGGGGSGGGISQETDPTVPDWAKQPEKPTYIAEEVGALPAGTRIPKKTSDLENDSGYITISVATLLNYYLKTEVYAKTEAYNREEVDNLISGLSKRLNAIADSTDVDLDQLSEIVAYIKSNKSLIDSITTTKVSVADIINNLATSDTKKPLSAAQGKVLKDMYDALPAWVKESVKPSYTKAEIGLGNVDNVRQYSAQNPPPYPVTSVNGMTGAVSLSASNVGARPDTWTPTASDVGALPSGTKIPAKTSDITNDSGFITKVVADLTNYYTKSQTYTQAEVNALVSAIPKFAISVVASLPTSGISTTTVYLVKSGTSGDLYTEYIYVNGAWEILGSQKVDLTGYATEAWVNTKIADFLTADDLTAAMVTGALGYVPADQVEVDELSRTIADLGGNVAPDYIVTEAERVAKSVQATRTAKSLVFPVMSDFHLFDGNSSHDASLISAQYAGMGVKELKKRLHLDFIGYLGDYTWGAADHTVEQTMRDMTAAKETTADMNTEIWCAGNHDINYGKNRDRLLTLDEVYGYIGANSDGVKPYENMERCYGYLDFENQKIRVIYLNTADASDWEVTDGEAARSEWISPTQLQWLADTALDFAVKDKPSEWGIVVVSHHPLHYGYSCFDNAMKIFEAYKDGLSGSLSCQNNSDTYETVTYDFTNTDKAEIICNIHGHNHNCGYSQISSTTRTGTTAVEPWLWRFCIPNLCVGRENSGYDNFLSNDLAKNNYGEVDENGNPVYWTKETGTAKATSFCVVDVDRKNKKIYAYIFGAGKDRVFNYDEEYVPVEYDVSVTLSNCTASGNNPSTITENGTATLTFTAADGYELPDSVTVTGASYTWDKASGALSLSNPTTDVVVSITAIEIVVEPTYDNLIASVGYDGNTRLISGGGTEARNGCGTTGFIEVPVPTSHEQGQIVLRVKNAEMVISNTSLSRFAVYDADKNNIAFGNFSSVVTTSYTQYKIYYEDDSNSYVTLLDFSSYIRMQHDNGKAVKYIKFCGAGIDGDTIVTLNEPIE